MVNDRFHIGARTINFAATQFSISVGSTGPAETGSARANDMRAVNALAANKARFARSLRRAQREFISIAPTLIFLKTYLLSFPRNRGSMLTLNGQMDSRLRGNDTK